jgi:hypothetical protein
MATILHFSALAKRPADTAAVNDQQHSAQLLFFTGVRYERHEHVAVQPAKPKRKRQAPAPERSAL